MFGPLAVAAVLAHNGNFRLAFGVLLIPAVINLSLVLLARFLYPRPEDMERAPQATVGTDLTQIFWIYLLGAILVAAGFADYPLIAYHFTRAETASGNWIAVFYAVAMAVSGTGSLVLGRLFDRYGFVVLVTLTLVSVLFAPLVFLGGFWPALIGAGIWGLGMGVHESIIPAAVSAMVSPRRRACVRDVYCRLWDFLVPRERGDRNFVRLVRAGGGGILHGDATGSSTHFYMGWLPPVHTTAIIIIGCLVLQGLRPAPSFENILCAWTHSLTALAVNLRARESRAA
jgi:MFS family permease